MLSKNSLKMVAIYTYQKRKKKTQIKGDNQYSASFMGLNWMTKLCGICLITYHIYVGIQ